MPGFSVSYTVTHPSGRRGFMKVLDLTAVFGELEELNIAIGDFIAERDLALLCGEERLSRVVIALDHGKLHLNGFFPTLSTVHYIIFEHADHDMNDVLNDAAVLDIEIRLHLIHHVAVGVQQLHRRRVAHQDLKPANLLIFGEPQDGEGKVADLGRAFQTSTPTPHDEECIPGDRSFAPIEQLYGYAHPEMAIRRFGADLYQLGSLICYAFGAATMNGLLAAELADEHHWSVFGDGYEEALPYLEDAYSHVITNLQETFPASVAKELTAIVQYLCQPDCRRRGHPRSRVAHGSAFSLERVISELNLASIRAGIRSRAAA